MYLLLSWNTGLPGLNFINYWNYVYSNAYFSKCYFNVHFTAEKAKMAMV